MESGAVRRNAAALDRVHPGRCDYRGVGVLDTFDERYDAHYTAGIAAKLGVAGTHIDRALVDDLLSLMEGSGADWTGTFRALAEELRGHSASLDGLVPRDGISAPGWNAGTRLWRNRVRGPAATADTMDERQSAVYPAKSPGRCRFARRHRRGPFAPSTTLLEVVTHPFDRRDEWSTTPFPPHGSSPSLFGHSAGPDTAAFGEPGGQLSTTVPQMPHSSNSWRFHRATGMKNRVNCLYARSLLH